MEHYLNKSVLNDIASIERGNYLNTYLDLIIKTLDPLKNEELLDIGCGHGDYTEEFSHFFSKTFGIEPFLKTKESELVEFCQCELKDFDIKVDKAIGKEMIHHIQNRPQFFEQLSKRINKKALFITRPQETTIPLFSKAKELFKKNQPHVDTILTEIPLDIYTYRVVPHSIPVIVDKSDFVRLVRDKFFSDLSQFSFEEIAKGIVEIEQKNGDEIKFEDKLLFIEIIKRDSLK